MINILINCVALLCVFIIIIFILLFKMILKMLDTLSSMIENHNGVS